MTTRLAALLLLAASTAACVTESVDLNLDDLPSYDESTGAGKADDANCTDETYRTFIQAYFAGTSAADTNPCTWGNDASFRIWAFVAGQQLAPTLDAYGTSITKRFNRQASKEQVIAAGTLDEATRAALAKLEAIRPTYAGRVGFAAWRDSLYKPTFDVAIRPVGSQSLEDGIDQRSNEVTEFENEWLAFAERSQPIATEKLAFAIWWEHIGPTVKELSGPISVAASVEERERNATLMTRIATTRPAGAFDEDALTFQAEIVAKIAGDYMFATDVSTAERWAPAATLKPIGGGPLSYKAWASTYANLAVEYNTRARNDGQRAIFELLRDARPCGSGPDVDELVTRLTTALANAGNDPAGTPLAQTIVPTACGAE